MNQESSSMKSITSVNLRTQFSKVINSVFNKKERWVITRRGEEVAVLIPIEVLRALEASHAKGTRSHTEQSTKTHKSENGLSSFFNMFGVWGQVKSYLGLN